MHPVVLASASPQRKRLLEGLGIQFTVVPSSYDESTCKITNPDERAVALAKAKAEHVAAFHPDAFVIGCDTLVVASDGTLLEKPFDAKDARRMLELQSGHTSQVHSGLCVISPEVGDFTGVATSKVTFKNLSDQEKDWWIDTNLWDGRSGGFQIDGHGQLIIEHLEGDWSNVVGLPVFLLGNLLSQAGFKFF